MSSNSGAVWKRDVVVKTMSGVVICYANVEASLHIEDFHRLLMLHYPGRAVTLLFKSNPVQLQRQFASLAAPDPIELYVKIGHLTEHGAESLWDATKSIPENDLMFCLYETRQGVRRFTDYVKVQNW
eukprot:10568886-Karenia_brevis.AAC.1